jgi:hypothetical protein
MTALISKQIDELKVRPHLRVGDKKNKKRLVSRK